MFAIGQSVTVADIGSGKVVGRTFDEPERITYDVELANGTIMPSLTLLLLAKDPAKLAN